MAHPLFIGQDADKGPVARGLFLSASIRVLSDGKAQRAVQSSSVLGYKFGYKIYCKL